MEICTGWWQWWWEATIGQGEHFGGQRKANQSFSSSMEDMKLSMLKEGHVVKTKKAQWLKEARAWEAGPKKRSQELHVEEGKERGSSRV